jgi:SAM-dependent methyltransferase
LSERDNFDELFDELYLRTYAGHEREDPAEEALGAARLGGLEPGTEVLDAPCGYGRHALVLAEAGYRVTGADRSPVLLAEARRRAGGAEWPHWVEADHRDLPFDEADFDAVLNLFSSLGYRGEEGDRRTLAEFLRVLRTGGALVVETMHRDRLMATYDPRDWDDLEGGAIRLDERRFDHLTGELEAVHTLVEPDGTRRGIPYTVRVYTATELARVLADVGFESTECFGDFDREPLSQHTRLVLLARKPG